MAAEADRFIRQNDEVFYTALALTRIDAGDIDWLKQRAAETPRRRARICTHPDADARLHEMLIVHACDTYVPPHRHVGRSESYHMIEGQMRIVLFEDDGEIRDHVAMSVSCGTGALYYRLSESRFHSMLLDSDWVVFHEVTSGPFDPATTIIPDWAPDSADTAAQRDFIARMRSTIA